MAPLVDWRPTMEEVLHHQAVAIPLAPLLLQVAIPLRRLQLRSLPLPSVPSLPPRGQLSDLAAQGVCQRRVRLVAARVPVRP